MKAENSDSSAKNKGRRKFLKDAAFLTGVVVAEKPGVNNGKNVPDLKRKGLTDSSEVLYNGIRLPSEWPPRTMMPDSYDPMPVPYLAMPPQVLPIDIGRQLFVDDFLIERTDLKRHFHQPVKHEGNPVLTPQTKGEMNQGYCPVASPFSDGVFYDPKDKLFKMWYMAGWFDGTALATSVDGIKWERPELDVVPGTNLVLNPDPELRRDSASVWLDHDASNPEERFKMYLFARRGEIGARLETEGGFMLSSPDGIHWKWHGKIGETGDNSTFFYNPFRKVWCFTVRRFGRAAPPWAVAPWKVPGRKGNGSKRGRARSYWENGNFFSALGKWEGFDPVFWFGADRFDYRRPDYDIGQEPQIYKVDAAGYESLMIGLIQPHYGPTNEQCANGGFPKLTELQIAFSRDGFHWDRTSRETFIGATLERDSWERGYIHSVGGVCTIVGDKLHFYYTAFRGNEANVNPIGYWSGLYANASAGLAILRRDGFASMDADKSERMLLTKILNFSGKYLFVNVEAPHGMLVAQICEEDGTPIRGFTREECIPVKSDKTKQRILWKSKESLETLTGKNVRFCFYLTNGKLYSFWVSKQTHGNSGGATAGGGPGLSGTMDV